jgi:hypothetical protein
MQGSKRGNSPTVREGVNPKLRPCSRAGYCPELREERDYLFW